MLKHRVLAAMAFAPALLGLVWWGGLALEITCFLLALIMLWEYQRMALGRDGELYTKGIGFILTALVAAFALGWLPAEWGGIALPGATMLLFVTMLGRPLPIERALHRTASVALGVLYCAGLIPFLARLRQLEDNGLTFGLMALFCTWAADTGAYFSGRFLGKHKLYPSVSPKKTIEGALGGLAAAVGVAFFIRWLLVADLAPLHTALLGLVAGALGVAGDLAESLLKRSTGVKDSSNIIPGHGGVLDRFDAVMFAAPAVYLYIAIFLNPTTPP